MITKKHLLFFAFCLFIVTLSGCGDDTDCCVLPPENNGYFIVNEGAFNNGNATLSFYSETEGQIYNGIFASANGRPLGDQGQSMSLYNGAGYIVVQNSGKVEVIDPFSYTSIATLTEGIESPRYFLGIDEDKAYLSDWGLDGISGTVRIIDLENMTVTGSIEVGHGPNRMLMTEGLVYLTHSGGFGKDNRVMIIDPATDQVMNSIEVGDNPNSIVEDAGGNLWVLSGGYLAFNPDFSIDESNSTYGSLSRIDENGDEQLRLELETFTYSSANNLVIDDNGMLYYTFNDQLFRMNSQSPEVPQSAFVDQGFYGLAINPRSGRLLGCIAPNFTGSGTVVEYDASGNQVNEVRAGIAPNSVIFR